MQPDRDHKTWILEIDYIRGMAIVAVVAMHCFPPTPDWYPGLIFHWTNTDIPLINSFILTATSFAAPLFMFISGFVLSHNYLAADFKVSSFIKRRLWYIAPPYIIFSLITIVGLGVINGFPRLIKIAFDLLTANASGPLWFFAIIIQLYFLYPFIIRIYAYSLKKNKLVFLFFILIAINWMWWSVFPYFQSLLNNEYFSVLLSRVIFPYLIFFIAGIFVQKNLTIVSKLLPKQLLLVLSGISLLLVAVLYLSKTNSPTTAITVIGTPVYILIVFILAYRTATTLANNNDTLSRILHSIGNCSFGIYLLHPFILYGFVILWLKTGRVEENNWLIYLALFVLTFALSFIITSLISYSPHSKFIIGIHRKYHGSKFSRT